MNCDGACRVLYDSFGHVHFEIVEALLEVTRQPTKDARRETLSATARFGNKIDDDRCRVSGLACMEATPHPAMKRLSKGFKHSNSTYMFFN